MKWTLALAGCAATEPPARCVTAADCDLMAHDGATCTLRPDAFGMTACMCEKVSR